MLRVKSVIVGSLLVVWQLGCGGGSPQSKIPQPSPQADISLSPANAIVGSPDLILTITATPKFSFFTGHKYTQAIWTANGTDTALTSIFLSSSELTAVVPASLLANPVRATLHVEVRNTPEDVPVAVSTSIAFIVTTPSALQPTITSISPPTAQVGNSDVTITISGSNFESQFLHWSVAFWATNPDNLHDTGTMLQTTFVSSSELNAVIPAALLQDPGSVQIVVLNGDVMGMTDGYFGYPKSNSVTFTVTP